MAKCKYGTLALKMEELLQGMEQFIEKSRQVLQGVQFHFYERMLVLGVPGTSKSSFDEQVKAHAIGMRFLSPSQELKAASRNSSFFGFYLPLRFRLRSQCIEVDPTKPFATWWAVKTTLPREMEPIIELGYWEVLLFCSDSTEHSYEIDWFEKENYTNTFTFQMESAFAVIGRENAGKAVIRKNLNQLALPYFHAIVEKWKNDPQGHDTIPKDFTTLFTKPFAPTESDYIAHAYQKVRLQLRERSLRNYEHLMILWRDFLENLMFSNVAWTGAEKEGFIKEWEISIFSPSVNHRIEREGRWEQARAIDKKQAGKIIKYFTDQFLADPSKHKKEGEIACLLWTLVWLSQDAQAGDITLARVLAFDTTNIDKDQPAILFDGKEVETSQGLYQLLQILQGKGAGKRSRLLFANLSSDYLQHAVKEASLTLFGLDSVPISPAAFLFFPHPQEGMRLTKQHRESCRAVDPGSMASHNRRQILKALRDSQSQKTSFSS